MSATATIADALSALKPDAIAICDPTSSTALPYRELSSRVDRAASEFEAAGLRAGDAVVLASPNSVWSLVVILALAKSGVVVVPVNPLSVKDELEYFCDDAEASLFIASAEVAAPPESVAVVTIGKEGLPELPAVQKRSRQVRFDEGAFVMIYTSGTTSRPKGVPLTHANILASVDAFAGCFQLTDSDATIVPMPFFHVHGLIGATLSTLLTGGTVILEPRFSASRFWPLVREHRVTWYSSSPTIHRILLARAGQNGMPRGQLRFIRSSSASLGIDTLTALEEQFGTVVLEGYGMTEAANQVACNPLPPGKREPGSVGIPQGVEIAVLDQDGRPVQPDRSDHARRPDHGNRSDHANGSDHAKRPDQSHRPVQTVNRGEIIIRGNSVMHGYHNRSELNAASFNDGWFRTGDEGYFDESGYWYIAGRIKELINRGGEKISPAEVEEVLLRYPQVVEAACFGVADPKYGEEVHAAVVLDRPVQTEDILLFCQKHLSLIKVPKKLHIVEKIPRNATNKIKRQELSEQFTRL